MTTYIHKPTKKRFVNKTEAILTLGYSNFKNAIENGEFTIITVREPNEIIFPNININK